MLVALGVLALGLMLPAAAYGWSGNLHQIVAWYRTVTETSAPNLLVAENISLATMWAKWLGAGALATRLAVGTGLASLGVAAATMTRRRTVSEPNYLEFGLLMLLVPLLSPQGWDYVLLLATPAIICLIDRLGDMSRAWRAWTMACAGRDELHDLRPAGPDAVRGAMAISIVSVAALALVVSLAPGGGRSRKTECTERDRAE